VVGVYIKNKLRMPKRQSNMDSQEKLAT